MIHEHDRVEVSDLLFFPFLFHGMYMTSLWQEIGACIYLHGYGWFHWRSCLHLALLVFGGAGISSSDSSEREREHTCRFYVSDGNLNTLVHSIQ